MPDRTPGDPRLENVRSREGKAARDLLIKEALARRYDVCCGGSAVPHLQFRAEPNERPYSFSLALNRITPTFYVRRPGNARTDLLSQFADAGAHENGSGEVKIPVTSVDVAQRITALL